MKTKIFALICILIFLAGCTQQGPKEKKLSVHAEDHIDTYPYEEISDAEIEALNLTINDEYRAKAIYRKVLDKFGEVKPFLNIINSEQSHIDELKTIYEKYNLTIPEDEWYDKVPEFDSVQEACQAGVQAEIDNAALYDRLFAQVDNQDITAVFTSLRDASEYNHLPAFRRCS